MPIVLIPTISSTYVKSTPSSTTAGFTSPLPAVDYANTSTAYYDDAPYNSWRTATSKYNGAKINIDYQTAFAATGIEICNYYGYDDGNDQTENTQYGFASVKVYGSNSATDFNNVTLNSVPANGTLLLNTAIEEQLSSSQETAIEQFSFTNTTSYRYYIIFFTGTYGGSQGGLRVLGLSSSGDTPITAGIEATLPSLSATLLKSTSLVNPPAFSSTYVKSSPSYGGIYGDVFRVVNPDNPVSGSASYASWLSNTNQIVGSKINIDYGSELGGFTAHLLRLWNFHNNGAETDKGIGSVRVYGSNTQADFDNTTLNSVPANGTLLLNTTAVARETLSSGTEQLFWLNNQTKYRYYILFFPTGAGHLNYTGIRRALLQGTPALNQCNVSATLGALQVVMDVNDASEDSILPIAQTEEFVKSLGGGGEGFYAHYATSQNDLTSLSGPAENNSWFAAYQLQPIIGFQSQNRCIPAVLDIENYHNSGQEVDKGLAAFELYGSNDVATFDNEDPQKWGNGTLLYSGTAEAHELTNGPDRQRFIFTVTESYRFFYLKILSNQGYQRGVGIRRFSLFGTIDPANYGYIQASIPLAVADFTAPVPELVASVSATINSLVAFMGQGAAPSLSVTIKALTAFMVVNNEEGSPVGNIDATLPSIFAENPQPAWGHLSATLPELTSVATAQRSVAASMAKLTSSIEAKPPGVSCHVDAELPGPDAVFYRGSNVGADIVSMRSLMDASVSISSVISSTTAPLVAAVIASAEGTETAGVDVMVEATIAKFTASLHALVGRSADIGASLRVPVVSIRAIPGVVADVMTRLPRLSAKITARPSSCTLSATIGTPSATFEAVRSCPSQVLSYQQGAIQ